jgi:hypothetical protein
MSVKLTRETTTVLEELQLMSRRSDIQPVSVQSSALPTGAATSAKQLADGHNVTANAGTNLNTSALATSAKQSDGTQASKFVDQDGTPYGVKHVQNKPRVSSMPYLYDIAEGNVIGHKAWDKIGYNPTMAKTVEEDIWSASSLYTWPIAADGWDVLSANAADGGVSIFDGTSTGGSLTSLIDTGKNFKAGTVVAIGDCIILDKAMDGGRTPEWGIVTAIPSNTEITVAGGFSSGGIGSGRVYYILDKDDATGGTVKTGAQAVKIEYLDGSYVAKSEIVILLASNARNTVNVDMFRVNSFRVIFTGTGNVAKGALSLRLEGGAATVYSYITAGMTRARNAMYTVPYGKTLYITDISFGFGVTGKANNEYGRFILRANLEPSTKFNTGGIFYVYFEGISYSNSIPKELTVPLNFPAKTDIKSSMITTEDGVAVCALRGWIE